MKLETTELSEQENVKIMPGIQPSGITNLPEVVTNVNTDHL